MRSVNAITSCIYIYIFKKFLEQKVVCIGSNKTNLVITGDMVDEISSEKRIKNQKKGFICSIYYSFIRNSQFRNSNCIGKLRI